MKIDRRVEAAAVCAAVFSLVAVAYHAGRAHADGVPATSPMFYSGTMFESGAAVNGARDITVQVWDSATSTAPVSLRCSTSAPATSVSAGRFRVALDDSCTPVVHATSDLWIELVVNGASQGRAKVGAAPFALEAGRAADLTPAARASLVPAGTIIAFAGSSAPSGWLDCDGSAVSRTTYPTLFAALGTTYGPGDGSSTFNLPDLRGRLAVGRGTNAQVDALTDSDGLAVGARKISHHHGRGSLAITGTGSSAHQHLTNIFQGFGNGSTPANAGSQNYQGYTSNFDNTLPGQGGHTHANGDFSGFVGDVAGPLDAPAFQVVNYVIKF